MDNGNNSAPSDGSYAATVSGTDLAGNAYVVGTESITFTLDTTGPTVILTDTDTDNLIPLSASVTITGAFSESLLSTPTLSLTGLVTNALMTRISSTNSYTYLWSVSPTTNSGIYTATVSGSDLQGNYNLGTQSITFTVDSSSPTVTITTSDSDNTIKPGEQITITATFSEAMGVTPTITIGSAVNNQGLSAVSTTTYRYIWSTSGVSPNSYTVSVSGQDLAGNVNAGTDTIDITLDGTPPTVKLTDTDSDDFLISTDTVTITAAFSEAMAATPTISISGVVSNILMSVASGPSSTGSITQLGGSIYGESRDNYFGWSVSIASDLNRVAVGAPRNDDAGSYSGHVRVFQWSGSAWMQLGADIDGEAANDNLSLIHI